MRGQRPRDHRGAGPLTDDGVARRLEAGILRGDMSGWDRARVPYPEGEVHVLDLGGGFHVESRERFDGGDVLCLDAGISMDLAIDSFDADAGRFSGEGWEVAVGEYGAPRPEDRLRPEAVDAVVRMAVLGDASAAGEIRLTDRAVLRAVPRDTGYGAAFDCVLTYRDGDASATVRGALVPAPGGPIVSAGDAFAKVPVDLRTLAEVKSRYCDGSRDTIRHLAENPFRGRPEAAAARRAELEAALAELRRGSRETGWPVRSRWTGRSPIQILIPLRIQTACL